MYWDRYQWKSIKIAKANGENLAPVKFIQSDLLRMSQEAMIWSFPIHHILQQKNVEIMPEVKDHEPMLALDGKEDGLYFYKKIIKEAKII